MAHRVLIIEDEATLAKNMTTYLQRQGYAVAAVSTGEAGLAQAAACRPDVVLLDYSLPQMTGLEVLAQLQGQVPPVPAIMITGHGHPALAGQARAAGAFAFQAKPLPLKDLAALLACALSPARDVAAAGEVYTSPRKPACG
jgi:two-component system, NtrC family, response regulator AtoC